MRKQQIVESVPAPPAPEHLSARSRELWASIVPRRAKSPERLALLRMALEALDRSDEAREALAQQGLLTVTESTKAVHMNPLVKVQKESQQLFAKVWGLLNLQWADLDGR